MFSTLTGRLRTLLFPVQCESCSRLPHDGEHWAFDVCPQCVSRIQWVRGPHCRGCGRTVTENESCCGQCHNASLVYDRAWACAYYDGVIKELLHTYKFEGRTALASFFSDILERFMNAHLNAFEFDAFAGIPLDRIKENGRGFNQAARLAASVAAKRSKPDLSCFLGRLRSQRAQAESNRRQRAVNVQGRFFVKKTDAFKGRRILLIDDILTTGFTASACSNALKNAGASAVYVLAVARGF